MSEIKIKRKKNKYTTNIYIDYETKNKLDFISKKMKRSNNNTIEYLITDYFENENKNNFFDNWKPIKELNLDNIENIRDYAYEN